MLKLCKAILLLEYEFEPVIAELLVDRSWRSRGSVVKLALCLYALELSLLLSPKSMYKWSPL